MFNDFFGSLVDFFRFGVEPSSENSAVLRRRFFAANFFARILRLLIFLTRLEWQSFTLKSKSLSRSLSDSLGVMSEKSSSASLSASSSSEVRSPVFSVELLASSTLRFRAEFDVSRSSPLVGCDFDTMEFRAFFFNSDFLVEFDCTVDVLPVVLDDVTNFDLFFASRFPPSANSIGFSAFGMSAYVYTV